MTGICFSMPDDSRFGAGLSQALGLAHGALEIHRFPDGESRVRLPADCSGRRVILVGGGRDPDLHALPLYFAAHAARAMGATSVGLVAPYLPYMRQDAQFHAGEAISALAYARFLSSSLDWIAAVDPHLHRIHSLDDIFQIPTLCISAMPAIGEWIAGNVVDPVIVGPDAESRQWAESVAVKLGVPWTVLEKTRTGDRQVAVRVTDPALLRGRSAVIVDDIASSGETLAEAARAVLALGSLPVTCVIVHALLSQAAEAKVRSAGVARLVSTNTLEHPASAIDVILIVAARVRAMFGAGGTAA